MTEEQKKAVLTLAKMGARVTFPDGRWIEGDPDTKYLDFGNEFGSFGLYLLEEKGVENILGDRDWERAANASE